MDHDYRLHLGLHKTGTTSFQGYLRSSKGELREHGVSFADCYLLRRIGLSKIGKFGWRQAVSRLRRRTFDRDLIPQIEVPANTESVAISEENFLSNSAVEILMETMYPRAVRNLNYVKQLLGGHRFQVFLSVRPYAAIIPSAYVQAIRWDHPANVPFAACLQRLSQGRFPSYVDLFRRISRSLKSDVAFWTLEDYLANPSSIASAFVGARLLGPGHIKKPSATSSPSADAVRKIEKLPKYRRRIEYRQAVTEIIKRDRSDEKFEPLPDDIVSGLEEAYQNDLLELQTGFRRVT